MTDLQRLAQTLGLPSATEGDAMVALAAANLHSLAERLTGAVERARVTPEDPEARLDVDRIALRVEELAGEVMAEARRLRRG